LPNTSMRPLCNGSIKPRVVQADYVTSTLGFLARR
jgi:hypothetical protein